MIKKTKTPGTTLSDGIARAFRRGFVWCKGIYATLDVLQIRRDRVTGEMHRKHTVERTLDSGCEAGLDNIVLGDVNETVDHLLATASPEAWVAHELSPARSLVCLETSASVQDDEAVKEVELDKEIRHALWQDEFYVLYQPIVDLRSREVLSWEALVRWRHPRRGIVSPATFVPVAERNGSIPDITSFVIDRVCRQLASTSRICKPEPVSVNISAVVLANGSLHESIAGCLKVHNVSPALLQIEITETAMLDLSTQLDEQLRHLRAMGVKVILDDFGTGYSSLMHLWKLPLDGVKIDGSFVQGLIDSDRLRSIVGAIARVAFEFGCTIVAEGVETEAQAVWLSQFQGMRGQGFLFSKPVFNPLLAHCRSIATLPGR